MHCVCTNHLMSGELQIFKHGCSEQAHYYGIVQMDRTGIERLPSLWRLSNRHTFLQVRAFAVFLLECMICATIRYQK